jgi:hypothetical protein
MSRIQEISEEIAASFEKHRKPIFQAQVLGKGEQFLFEGEGVLEDEKSVGAFWPSNERSMNVNSEEATILKHSDGREFIIHDFKPCPTLGNPHFHFRWNLKPK